MGTMKIENYSGTANTFTFPDNPKLVDDASNSNMQVTNVPFSNVHIFITSGALDPKNLTLNGFFRGASKLSNYNTLTENVFAPQLKKLYFETDRFYIVKGLNCKKTNQGGRTQFIDYVANFATPISFVFSDTQKSASYNGSAWTDGTQTNAGSHVTYIEEIVVSINGNGSNGTFIIADNSGNGITVTLSSYTSGDTLIIYLIRDDNDRGIYTTENWYCTLNGVKVPRKTTSGKYSLNLSLQPEEAVNTLTISGTLPYSTSVIKWRDAYLG